MKKTLKIIIGITVVIIILLSIYIVKKNKNKQNEQNEYLPEEEISVEEERQTMVSLYFRNKSTKNIEPEARLIDVKELVKDPYKVLINLLIAGPKNENLEGIMPSGTIVNNAKIENDVLTIDFSKEFIENNETGKQAEEQIMESIVKTLTELTEVNSIKITISGEENKAFKDNEVTFKNDFLRPE